MQTETGIFIRSNIAAILACILWETPVFSEEQSNPGAPLPENLGARKRLYEEQIERAVKPVKDRYRRDLELMIDGYARARDLDSSLAVSNELKILDGVDEVIEEAETESPKLVDLKQDYSEELQRVQAPVNEQYLRDLKVMIEDYTRSRELEAAVAVRSELQRLERLQQSSDPDGLTVWLLNHILTWKGQNGFVEISFDQKKATVSSDGREIMERSYTIKDEDTVEFEWSANDTNSFTLSKDRRSFVRSSSSGSANHEGEVKRR